jgi:hypothetical protein
MNNISLLDFSHITVQGNIVLTPIVSLQPGVYNIFLDSSNGIQVEIVKLA